MANVLITESTVLIHTLAGLICFVGLYLSILFLEHLDYGEAFQLKAIDITLAPAEVVFKSGKAKYLKGEKAIAGKLFVTSQRLVFIAHRQALERLVVSISSDEIQDVRTSSMAFGLPSALECSGFGGV